MWHNKNTTTKLNHPLTNIWHFIHSCLPQSSQPMAQLSAFFFSSTIICLTTHYEVNLWAMTIFFLFLVPHLFNFVHWTKKKCVLFCTQLIFNSLIKYPIWLTIKFLFIYFFFVSSDIYKEDKTAYIRIFSDPT